MTAALFASASMGAAVPTGFATVNSPVQGVIPGPGACTTSAASVTALGGATIETYAWSQIDGDDNWTINAPSSASTTFTYAGLHNGDIQPAQFQCVATDTGPDPDATTTLTVTAIVRSTSTL